METSDGASSDPYRSQRRRYGIQFSASNFIQAPLTALLDYSGILRPRPIHHSESEGLVGTARSDNSAASDGSSGEVSIRIIGAGEHESARAAPGRQQLFAVGPAREGSSADNGAYMEAIAGNRQEGGAAGELTPPDQADGEANVTGGSNRDSSYQRYDIQQVGRWIEQLLPFTLLLLIVFIRQHWEGFFVVASMAAVIFKSNDILRKQTALKGERNVSVLVGITVVFIIHVIGVYWWYRNDDLLYPLIMLPPKAIPPFWHAIFMITVNDTMVREAAMILKCVLLMYYKNSRGHNYRRQGQMLTLVEYLLLLYRALLPTSVWYRFFLNKEYGTIFSSLTTGLYLTFKLTSIVEKVQSFFAALKALSQKEVHYGSYATKEQVVTAGDLCAICQEKMHAPILLRCKHIFCEDCVSEWFERERTCPLCRALVKPADFKSFSDGSTSLFFQLF